MGMKYRDPETGQFKDLKVKTSDTLPVGTVVDFDGDEVPAGWEAAGSDDYSTEETFTGKYWIDGKKIYRKVVSFTYQYISKDISLPIGITDLETLVSLNGIYEYKTGGVFAPYPLTQNTGTVLNCVFHQGSIEFVGNQDYSAANDKTHTFILEYTKK